MKKKAIIGVLLTIPAAAGLYFIYKHFKSVQKSDVQSPSEAESPLGIIRPSTGTVSTSSSSTFPIKRGSRGEAVKSLQTALNAMGEKLTVDGIFGPKTEEALCKRTQTSSGCKKTINAQNEINALLDSVKRTNLKAENLSWAWKLVDAYKLWKSNADTSSVSNLVVLKEIKLYGIEKNFAGSWKSTGKNLNMPPLRYSLNDYQVASAMSDGSLRLVINRGDLAGTYFTDPAIRLSEYLDIR